MEETPKQRLDSWKEIASYLGRDVSTVMRWEKKAGLPVHRVPASKGSSVYAYKDELDGWVGGQLAGRQALPPGAPLSADEVGLPGEEQTRHSGWRTPTRYAVLIGAAFLTLALTLLLISGLRRPPRPETLALVGSKLLARDVEANILWEYTFPQALSERPPAEQVRWLRLADLDGDGEPETLAATHYQPDQNGGLGRSEIFCLSARGKLLWRYEPPFHLAFAGNNYAGPWRINDLLVSPDAAPKKIWLAFTHNTWWPSFLVELDSQGRAAEPFVNSGWIESLRYARTAQAAYVLAGGINNEYDAAFLALLKEGETSGVSPQTAGSKYVCDRCPDGRPVKYFLFPRSELSLLIGDFYNQVGEIHITKDEIVVRTLEFRVDGSGSGAFYGLSGTPDLAPVFVRFDDAYEERHRQLERQNRITHPVPLCPELTRGMNLRVWSPESGWVNLRVPAGSTSPSTSSKK